MKEEGEGDFQFDFNEEKMDAELAKILGELKPKKKDLCRALIATPIDAPAALRAALDMMGSPASVISTGSGSGVYLEVEGEDADAEMMTLLGEDRPLPDQVDTMARLLSKLTKNGAVVVASWVTPSPSNEDEENDSPKSTALVGSMVARRYVNAQPEETLPVGMVLNTMSVAAEELLLGRITLDEVDGFSEKGPWTGWPKRRGR